MHPTLRQVPPKGPCSQIATRMSPYRGSPPGSAMLLPEPVPMMARSKCTTCLVLSGIRWRSPRFGAQVVVEPAGQLPVRRRARLGQGQEDVVLGVADRRDRLTVPDAARP